MSVIAATLAVALLSGLGWLQALVAVGRPHGRFVWGGSHDVLPRRLRAGSAISVPIYAAIAVTLLWRSGVFGLPSRAVVIATWVLVGYFALAIVMNAISRSRAERLVMTPVCAVLTLCSLALATA